jgi:hypothetical protein
VKDCANKGIEGFILTVKRSCLEAKRQRYAVCTNLNQRSYDRRHTVAAWQGQHLVSIRVIRKADAARIVFGILRVRFCMSMTRARQVELLDDSSINPIELPWDLQAVTAKDLSCSSVMRVRGSMYVCSPECRRRRTTYHKGHHNEALMLTRKGPEFENGILKMQTKTGRHEPGR